MNREEKILQSNIIQSLETNISAWRVVTGHLGSWCLIHERLNIEVDKRYSKRRCTVSIGGSYLSAPHFIASRRLTRIARKWRNYLCKQKFEAFRIESDFKHHQALVSAIQKF